MEPTKREVRLTPEAKETVERILVHILNPLHDEDRQDLITSLCEKFGVIYDPYY